MGIYSDPGHVFAYGGEIRKEFSIRVACTITGGSLSVRNESTDVRFFAPEDIPGLPQRPVSWQPRDHLDVAHLGDGLAYESAASADAGGFELGVTRM